MSSVATELLKGEDVMMGFDHKNYRSGVGCSCNSPEELVWDCAGMAKGNFSCSFFQEFPLFYGLCGIRFFFFIFGESKVCMWEC